MFGEHHDLESDLPEFKSLIERLRASDSQFAKLYEEYLSLDEEVYRIEEQIETPSDDYTEERKKRRMALKDQLFSILQQH